MLFLDEDSGSDECKSYSHGEVIVSSRSSRDEEEMVPRYYSHLISSHVRLLIQLCLQKMPDMMNMIEYELDYVGCRHVVVITLIPAKYDV